jgi:putative transposase
MDWVSRWSLTWRPSNTTDAEICIQALHEAIARFRRPAIFCEHQRGQFVSPRFTKVLVEAEARISMYGRERWLDNRFIGWLQSPFKHACGDLNTFEAGSEALTGIADRSSAAQAPCLTTPWAVEPRWRSRCLLPASNWRRA